MIKSIKFFHSSNVIYPEGSRFGITIYLRDKDLKVLIKILMLAALLFCGAMPARAQSKNDYIPPESENKPYRLAYYTDAQWVEFEGDSLPMYTLRRITVFAPLKFKNKKEEQFYWRTVRNVRIMLPYAKMIKETLVETYEYIETFPTQKEREAYLKQMEKELFNQYKPVLRKFSRNQAKLLIKLIQRETDQTSYDIVRAFLGSTRALFWQGFGRFFGVNLKGRFEPDKNREDEIINRIATRLEEGTL